MSQASQTTEPTGQIVWRSAWIANPWFDSIFFIGAPIWAVAIATICAQGWVPAPGATDAVTRFGFWAVVVSTVFTHGHLPLVFIRSHANPKIFALYPARFTLVPLALFIACAVSPVILTFALVLGVWWDVYHSAAQTFGLGRIYDMRAGNPSQEARSLDWWLNVVVYFGPILGGATLAPHMAPFGRFEEIGFVALSQVPAHAEGFAGTLTWLSLIAGAGMCSWYVWRYVQLARAGYAVSIQKVTLVAGTTFSLLLCWAFNPFGIAFMAVNLFHAVQYYAIVWQQERKGGVQKRLGIEDAERAGIVLFVGMLLLGTVYGLAFVANKAFDGPQWLASLFVTCTLMHFWYDGFVWSVRKGQIAKS